MGDFVSEIQQLPVKYEPDVVVVGGGIAGIAAALAAARNNANVLLIEKQCIVGGLATSGLITDYLPLCDGNGHQVSFGIAEELLKLSIKHGAQSESPIAWLEEGSIEEREKKRYRVQFNPQYFALLAEGQLLKDHVHILYDTKLCNVIVKRNRMTEILIENKSGRAAVRAKTYIDATGDADLYWYADVPTRLFSKGNILAGWYYYYGRQAIHLRSLGYAEVFDEDKKDKVKPIINRHFSGVDGQEISEYLCLSHKATLNDLLEKKERDGTIEPTAITTMPQLRMTRCIIGEYVLKESENSKEFIDSIGVIADWRKKGMIYEIPYRSLYNSSLKNVISVGRCISVDDGMWDISRVIPACAVTGEAAGTAAAITDDFTTLDYSTLSRQLIKQGQKLKISDIH